MATEQLPVTDGAATGSHHYARNGTYTITVTGDVTGATDTVDVTIAGIDVTGTLTLVNVDGYLNVSAEVDGLEDDTTATVDWGDGTEPETLGLTTGGIGSIAHDYADASGSPYTVTVTGDQSGAVLSDTIEVAVHEPLALAVDVTGDPTADFTLSGVWAEDTTVTLDYGDGSGTQSVIITDGAGSSGHLYRRDGEYTATATGDVTGQTDTVTVTIAAAPVLTIQSEASADPSVAFEITNVLPTDATVTIDYGDGTATEQLTVTSNTATTTHVYADNGTYTVTVTGDSSGETASTDVTIAAAPMTATATGDPDVTLNVTNIDATDTSVTVDWGDA